MRFYLLVANFMMIFAWGCGSGDTQGPPYPATNPSKTTATPLLKPVGRTRESVRAEGFIPREAPWPGSPQFHRTEGYVGSSACKECHAEQHHSWDNSYHSTMTQVASRATVIPEIKDVELAYQGREGSLEWRDDELWATVTDTEGTTVQNRVVLTTGSHHAQAFWYQTGDTQVVQMFPFAYRIAEQRWIPVQTAFLLPPEMEKSFSFAAGVWNHSCSQCHATSTKPLVTTAEQMQTQVADFGIACEACHGPGEEHIRAVREQKTENLQIVNPNDLDAKISSQVCGQCHAAISLADKGATADWLQHGWRYRPGEELDKSKTIIQPANDGKESIDSGIFWNDGTVRVSGREFNGLLKSPCYNHGGDTGKVLSCTSCHNMHLDTESADALGTWSNHQLKPDMRSNLACTQCHEEYREEAKLVAHTHHPADSGGSNCMNCHMPYTSYGLLKASRSHQIENPSVTTTLETGRPNGCNQCHLDKSLGWTAAYLNQWYGIESPELSDEDQNVSSTVLSCLKGNAIQRALAGWTIGWPEAHKASTTDWVIPYLGFLLQDNYHAVRFIANRSLQGFSGYEQSGYDSLAQKTDRDRVARQIVQKWRSQVESDGTTGPAVLIAPGGQPMIKQIDEFLQQRDLMKIFIGE